MAKEHYKLHGHAPRPTYQQWAGLLGVIAPTLMMGLIALAVTQAPWWSITDNSISRLAGAEGDQPYWSATGAPAIILNAGLFSCGTIMTAFALVLYQSSLFHIGVGNLGKVLYISSSVMMTLVGVFPLTFGNLHDVVSYSLFTITPLAMLLMGISAAQSQHIFDQKMGAIIIALAVCAAFPFFVNWPWAGLAIPEIMAIVPQSLFAFVLGAEMIYG